MTPSKNFLKITGFCGMIAGIATLLLWLLPLIYGRPTGGLEVRLALHENPLYIIRSWISFINVFFIVMVSWGLTLYKINSSPASASTGMLFLFIYAIAELLGRATMVFVRENRWVDQWLTESDPAIRENLLSTIQRFDEVWGGFYFLLLTCFAIAALCFSLSIRKEIGLGKWVSRLLLAASMLAFVTLVALYSGSSFFRFIAIWGYPLVQPLSRFMLGLWLWKSADLPNDITN